MRIYYKLNPEGEPVPCEDVIEWGKWFERANRTVLRDELPNNVRVSTVFLGLDHNFGGPQPLLWETMIFGGPHADYQERYATREDAIAGHARAKAIAMGETLP